MIKNRIVKWGTAGVLALGTIPALTLAKSHVSLPTSDITVTPTSAMEAPATKTLSRVTHAKSGKVSKASTKTRSSKHHKGTSSHHKSGKAVSTHKKTASAKVKAASSKAHKTSSSKVIRVD